MKTLKQLQAYSLSDEDIHNVFKPKKINIIMYQDLDEYKKIDDLFKNSNFKCCVLFIPENMAGDVGHWTCIIKHKSGKYEYFDSYKGYEPDEEAEKWLSSKVKKKLDIDSPLLTDLFLRSGVDRVIINPYPFQQMKRGINTCGREVCSRILHRDLSLKEYWQLINNTGMKPDEYTTLQIYKILGK